jgi:hypothetical protein
MRIAQGGPKSAAAATLRAAIADAIEATALARGTKGSHSKAVAAAVEQAPQEAVVLKLVRGRTPPCEPEDLSEVAARMRNANTEALDRLTGEVTRATWELEQLRPFFGVDAADRARALESLAESLRKLTAVCRALEPKQRDGAA